MLHEVGLIFIANLMFSVDEGSMFLTRCLVGQQHTQGFLISSLVTMCWISSPLLSLIRLEVCFHLLELSSITSDVVPFYVADIKFRLMKK